MNRKLTATAIVGLGLTVAYPALGWGHIGHADAHQLAIKVLPDGPLKAFFQKNQAWIVSHASDPDTFRRGHETAEGPHHFLWSDAQGVTPATYPRTWAAAVSKFGLAKATQQGQLPWAVQAYESALVDAFKAKDGTKIVETATWLGHYAADLHVPLHVSANPDGQLTGQAGVHSLWEEDMLKSNLSDFEPAVEKLLASAAPAEIEGDLVEWGFDRIDSGERFSKEILAADKPNATAAAGARAKALWAATSTIAEQRLADSAVDLASLWLTAWVKAGKPALPKTVALPAGATLPPVTTVATAPAHTADALDRVETRGLVEALGDQDPPLPGVSVHYSDDGPGAIVDAVDPESDFDAAGLRPGDVILGVDRAPVGGSSTLARLIADHPDKVVLTISRGGERQRVKLPEGDR